MAGINFSQINGDVQDGYQKKGPSLGLTGSVVVSPDFEICTELLYNEKGAKPNSNKGFQVDNYYSTFSLKYSEVALLAHYFFKPKIAENYYEQSLKIGFSYGRLIKSQTNIIQNHIAATTLEQYLTQNFNRNDFSFVAAWAFYLSPRLSLSLRHTNTLNFLYKGKPAIEKEAFKNMRPYFFTCHLIYDFIAPHKVTVVRKRKKARFDPLEEL
jgi:hypothetical protein